MITEDPKLCRAIAVVRGDTIYSLYFELHNSGGAPIEL